MQQGLLAWKESVIEEERTHINDIVQPQWFDRAFASALGIEDLYELEVEMKLAFEDIAFENLKDKALAVLPLYEAGLLPDEKVLEIFGFDDVIDQLKALKDEKQKAQAELQQRMQEENQKLQQQSQDLGQGIKYPAIGGRGLLTTIEKDEARKTIQQEPQQTKQAKKND